MKGLRPSVDTEGSEELQEDTVDVDVVVEDTTGTDFNGEIATLALGGDKSRLSLRGAQLMGTLKLKNCTVSSFEISLAPVTQVNRNLSVVIHKIY